MGKKKQKAQDVSSQNNFGLSLGALLKEKGVLLDDTPSSSPSKEKAIPAESEVSYDLSSCPRLVIRHETKRRKGKTVTLVKGFNFSEAQLKKLAKDLRHALGCGAGLEDGGIALQGDQIQRVHAWLQRHGAQKITLATRPKRR